MLLWASILNAYNFGKNKIQAGDLKWSKIATMHFDIYFQKGEDDFGKIAALMAEEAYYKIKQDLRTPIQNRIPIIFYKSRQDFETTIIIYYLLNEGVGGFTETSRNRVAVPFTGSYKELEKVLIHELTHAYINGLNRQRNQFLNLSGLPFWFSEGLPEFFSVEGRDIYNNMFVIDLLFNDKIPNLDEVSGYYSYRLGESFLSFVSAEFGRESVTELFYALRYNSTSDLAFKKVFDLNYLEIQKRWKNYLKRQYFCFYDQSEIPYETLLRRTDHEKDGSYLNFAPRFSPDGLSFLYFSNKNIRNEIWLGSTLELKEPQRILKGEATGRFEEFHFQRNNLSWFSDGNRFAFVAKTSIGDKIYIMNLADKKIEREIFFEDVKAIFEIDVSNDDSKIAFCGQTNQQSDIYVYYLEKDKLIKITDDLYHDFQPRWSSDDSRLAFASERLFSQPEENVFYALSSDVFYYDFTNSEFYRVTDDKSDNDTPVWSKSSEVLLFISNETISMNVHAINLETGERAQVTNLLGGVFTCDLSKDDTDLILSVFFDGGWDIYIKSNPLKDLLWEDYSKPEIISLKDDLLEKIDIERFDYYGYVERKFKDEAPAFSSRQTVVDFKDFARADSLRRIHNLNLDKKPTEINPPVVSDYKTRFALDYIWGGMAYSPSSGTYAQLQFGMSDLMGNHAFSFDLGITGSFDYSDYLINYIYLAKRIDYGLGLFMLNDDYYYKTNFYSASDYFRERINQIGFYGIMRYPFNKFWRIDWENIFYRINTKRDWWDGNIWLEEYLPPAFAQYFDLKASDSRNIYSPQISLTHDNAIFGAVGPISGWRGTILINRTFSNKFNYSVLYGDIRSYNFFAKRYSLAFRAAGGTILGDTDQLFEMDYFGGVRGYRYDQNEDLLGKHKVFGSMELRFPFVDRLNFAFPLPIYLYQIRGSAFLDIGSIWTDDLRLMESGKLKDLLMGIGFGPRLNLGYFVLKFDIAWQTDLKSFSKPSYYITLTPDF